jgi:hypothetical protein
MSFSAATSSCWFLRAGSPAFIENYFKRLGFAAPIQLVENKVLRFEDSDAPTSKRNRPQCVGWFGMIRCRRGLEV